MIPSKSRWCKFGAGCVGKKRFFCISGSERFHISTRTERLHTCSRSNAINIRIW